MTKKAMYFSKFFNIIMYIFDQIILIFFEIKNQLSTTYIFNAHCKKWKHCFELGQKVPEGGPAEKNR